MRNVLLIGVIGAIVLTLGWWYASRPEILSTTATEGTTVNMNSEERSGASELEAQGAAIGRENLVTFVCADGKTITAVFERDIVGLTLSDGRSMKLRNVATGTAVRYVSSDANIEFRGQGEIASLWEKGNVIYSECTTKN